MPTPPRLALLLVLLTAAAVAQDTTAPTAPRPDRAVGDYGPFLSCTLMRKTEPKKLDVVSLKGIVIKLPGPAPAAVCFDTDTLTLTSAWTGGSLDFSNTMIANYKGTDLPAIDGVEVMSAAGPGWAKEGSFADPRRDRLGPLPREWGRYKGLYVSGDRVVVSYTVPGCDVLETYQSSEKAIRRIVRLGASEAPLKLLVSDSRSAVVQIENQPKGAEVKPDGEGRLVLSIPAHAEPLLFAVRYGGEKEHSPRPHALDDPSKLVSEHRARYGDGLTLSGVVANQQAPYVLDRLTLPDKNPWDAWMRLTAFDFFPDGRAAVATLNGDVWLLSGIDGSLKNLRWKRFATGLYEPMGLKIVEDKIYVLGRDQITRLHDSNDDGEADFYENFNNDGVVNPSYHGFAFELQTDSQGNFYYSRTGHRAPSGYPGHGCVIKVSKAGDVHEVIATGLRAPNGVAVGPNDEIAVADNQGNWVPTTRLDIISSRPKGDKPFLGYLPQHHRGTAPTECPQPMTWIPHKLDPSAGSSIWVNDDKWGPFKGALAHTSFGRASLLMVLPDHDYRQGAVVRMPLNFDTGIMRAKFHPKDGQLYVAGLGGGWQAGGPKDGGLYRVRYTGKPVHLPRAFNVEKTGIRLAFPHPLDRASASDPDNYGLEQWNYKWTEAYGSLEYSVEDPSKKGRDEVELKSVTLSDDARSVLLEIPDLKPVMQMLIQTNIKAADGASIETEVYGTINVLPN